MDEVIAADGQGVAISHRNDQLQLRAADLHAGGEGQRPAVNGMQRVKIDITGNSSRTTDAGYHDDVVFAEPQLFDRPEWLRIGTAQILHAVQEQHPHGFWPEGDGPVMGYNLVYTHAIGLDHAFTGDKRVLPADANGRPHQWPGCGRARRSSGGR